MSRARPGWMKADIGGAEHFEPWRRRWGRRAALALATLAQGCGGLPGASAASAVVSCGGEQRTRVDCSASQALRSQVFEVNAGLSQIGLGFQGKYEAQALQQVRESTEHLAINLESLCEDYNACVLDRERYADETARIRELLSRHMRLAEEQERERAPDPARGDQLWSNARPDLAGARLSLAYQVEVRSERGYRAHRSGDVLHSGDEVRFVLEPSRAAFVYVLLLSSQGTSVRLFPSPEYGLDNPVSEGARLTVPPPARARLQLDAVTGVEHLQIVASSTPLDGLAQAAAPPPPGSRAERPRASRILLEVGQLLCPESSSTAPEAAASSVACNGHLVRGLTLLGPAPAEAASSVQTLLAQPNDDVVVFQHEIVHR